MRHAEQETHALYVDEPDEQEDAPVEVAKVAYFPYGTLVQRSA